MHTNPILICFCSILYYRNLAEHIRRYKIEKELVKALETKNANKEIYFKLKTFSGYPLLNDPSSNEEKWTTKTCYSQHVKNRWHLIIRLSLNKELIQYRRHNLNTKNENESLFSLTKVFLRRKILLTKTPL